MKKTNYIITEVFKPSTLEERRKNIFKKFLNIINFSLKG